MTLGEDLLIALSLNDMQRPSWDRKRMLPQLPHPEGKGITTHLLSNKAPQPEPRPEYARIAAKKSRTNPHVLAAGCSRRALTFSA